MHFFRIAVCATTVALALASPVEAQAVADLSTIPALRGDWNYATTPDGSEAVFRDEGGVARMWLHCTHFTRQVTVSKMVAAPISAMNVWTSSKSQTLAATYNPANARVSFSLYAFNPLFDAMAFSRGRFGISAGNEAPVVVPPWEEVARVVEDCRV